MDAETSRSNSTADSYVGSLISLTSKSEIRYEGILYNINTDESNIGLRNVRSFGTEGRKKDGPQVMPSDKVYEYILFRGSDIKDLQVKSSPPVQPTIQTAPPINNDPAIIQSHYPRPSSTSSSLPAVGTGSLPDLGSHSAQLGQHGSNYQGGMPLYQPGGSLGSWGPTPPPSANAGGLAMPMYWPGFYAPPNGLTQLHQQSLLRPPPGLSMPPSMQQQQPMQYPTFNASMPAGASNVPGSNLPEYPLPTVTTSLGLSSTSLPSILPHIPPATLPSEALPSFMQNKAPNSAAPLSSLNSSLPSLSQLSFSSQDVKFISPPISNKAIASPSMPYQGISQPISSVAEISGSIQTETVKPVLVTPGHLLPSGKIAVSKSQSLQTAHKDVEVVQICPSSELPALAATEAQPPILPLPTPSRTDQKPNGAPYQARHNNYRGRERGRGPGNSRPTMKFTEEFDFTAMNEKFNKDEVWGHLGKSNKSNLKGKEGGENASEDDQFEDEGDADSPQTEVKPVYIKDDFFDSLSSNAVDNQSNNGRTRFSEQMKLDTETFGEFSRYRGRGGPGPSRGGGCSGGYYGRGYGYTGRGLGRNVASRYY